MPEMVNFYHLLLNTELKPVEMFGSTLYSGEGDIFDILLCPKEIAGNSSTQNRYQLHFEIDRLDRTVEILLANGGTLLNEKTEHGGYFEVGIYDPDMNSMVLRQKIKEL